jgi:hypothetical protein
MVNLAKLLLVSGTATLANCVNIKYNAPDVSEDYMS